jgi:hypothetical protein
MQLLSTLAFLLASTAYAIEPFLFPSSGEPVTATVHAGTVEPLAPLEPVASSTGTIAAPVQPDDHASTNTTTEDRSGETCVQPKNAVKQWYYNKPSDGPYECSSIGDKGGRKWAMLSAYRRSSKGNVYWRTTNDENDPSCLTNWSYYNGDGSKILGHYARTTTERDMRHRRWCPLPVYRLKGKQGKQWEYCTCT